MNSLRISQFTTHPPPLCVLLSLFKPYRVQTVDLLLGGWPPAVVWLTYKKPHLAPLLPEAINSFSTRGGTSYPLVLIAGILSGLTMLRFEHAFAQLWLHTSHCPSVFRKHCLVATHHLWLLQSSDPFPNEPWALGGGNVVDFPLRAKYSALLVFGLTCVTLCIDQHLL